MTQFLSETKASVITRHTGINPDELLEAISAEHRNLLLAKKEVKLHSQLKDIKLNVLIEKRRLELTTERKSFTESALKSYAHAHPEYREAVLAEDESDGRRIEIEVKHKQLRDKLDVLYEEAKSARSELYTLGQKQ